MVLILPGRILSLSVLLTTQPAKSKDFLQEAYKDLGAVYAISLENNRKKSSFFIGGERKWHIIAWYIIFGTLKCIFDYLHLAMTER